MRHCSCRHLSHPPAQLCRFHFSSSRTQVILMGLYQRRQGVVGSCPYGGFFQSCATGFKGCCLVDACTDGCPAGKDRTEKSAESADTSRGSISSSTENSNPSSTTTVDETPSSATAATSSSSSSSSSPSSSSCHGLMHKPTFFPTRGQVLMPNVASAYVSHCSQRSPRPIKGARRRDNGSVWRACGALLFLLCTAVLSRRRIRLVRVLGLTWLGFSVG